MSKQVYAAQRVATFLGVVKWLTIAVLGVGGVLTGLQLITAGTSSTEQALGFLVLVVAGVNALVTWALFGWLQHMLGMLTVIAANTAPVLQPNLSAPVPAFTQQGL
ncbi:hypothetical protein [Kribbella soli]|uniref:Uncharacterized protein n=1 Tax=Kribbella soli TaxID=1124743 RepID=A0A4R0GXL1_9ACTN|nr:hypothetical protein [Kribbella soli]TCC01938.1 hypothetical protein E0H45_41465 [Kribbella soli]